MNSIITIKDVTYRYRKNAALKQVNLSFKEGERVAIIGPDGVGKSTLLSLISGGKKVQEGDIFVFGKSIKKESVRSEVCHDLSYMPQGLGSNLYPTLTVEENLQFFGKIFNYSKKERWEKIVALTKYTDLYPFLDRPVMKLSGGMKQKLGLCIALLHSPKILILDEPTTGVDPLARAQFWSLLKLAHELVPSMTIIVATDYFEEVEHFDHLVAMYAGEVLQEGSPSQILSMTQTDNLEDAFVQILPQTIREGHQLLEKMPLSLTDDSKVAILAEGLSKTFGDFTAVKPTSFKIYEGEIFGFLGSNGCGKTTTMKMLTGLITPTEGSAVLFDTDITQHSDESQSQIGYMSQNFSLYKELTVYQNLSLHAHLFHIPLKEISSKIEASLLQFDLIHEKNVVAGALPLGVRQRLSLAIAMIHSPKLLILDEPTSGVDPITRDHFWNILINLSRKDGVTIFISTHFMNEAVRCDRISMMHAGKVLASDTPQNLIREKNKHSLEEAFVQYILDENGESEIIQQTEYLTYVEKEVVQKSFSMRRLLSYSWREILEIKHDYSRAIISCIGSMILMLALSFGLNIDIKDVKYAVLDHDQSALSYDYRERLGVVSYFKEMPQLFDRELISEKFRRNELKFIIEIPEGFSRNFLKQSPVEIVAWIDGSMPQQADVIKNYLQGVHTDWLQNQKAFTGGDASGMIDIIPRFRYNDAVDSSIAFVPTILVILLLIFPAILTALSVVREKEQGTIINFYITPMTRLEFVVGKQLPYWGLAYINYLGMFALAIWVLDVPIKGSFLLLSSIALMYSMIATSIGFFYSVFTKSQISAIFLAMMGTLIPAMQFSGMVTPITSLEGVSKWISEFYPATHMITISQGIFNKSIGVQALYPNILFLFANLSVILICTLFILQKQER